MRTLSGSVRQVTLGRTLVAATAFALLGSSTVAAQEQPLQGRQPLATVTGVVYDSLSSRPIAGVAIWSEQARRATVTDSLGRFSLDSLTPGFHRLVVADSVLDVLGIDLSRTVQVGTVDGAGNTRVVLATPSVRTVTTRRCTEGTRVGDRSSQGGILFGGVRNAATGAMLAAAVVEITWLRIHFERGKVVPLVATAQVRSDSTGTFTACGLPTDTLLQVTVYGGSRGTSGDLELLVGPRHLARLDVAVPGSAGADSSAVVRGQVIDSAGAPMPDVSVAIEGARDGRTGSDGRFLLSGLPLGTQTLLVRRPGFAPHRQLVALSPNDTVVVRVPFQLARLLPTIAVRSPRASRTMREFEQRRRTRDGTFLTMAEIGRRPDIRSVFFGIPRVKVTAAPGGFQLWGPPVRLDQPDCPMSIVIDGWRATIDELRLYKPEDIQGIEVYPKADQTPLAFRGQVSSCGGAVVVWTRWL